MTPRLFRTTLWLPRALALALAMVVVATPAAPAGATLRGTVIRVTDGDTLWLRPAGGGRPLTLRLQGIDAPERCQAWGPQATQALAGLVLHQPVQVDPGPRDGHGRRLGRLWRGSLDVGAWMVGQGHAWNHRWRGQAGPYAAEERQARAARRGLFAQPEAQPPAQFRRQHGPCPATTGPLP